METLPNKLTIEFPDIMLAEILENVQRNLTLTCRLRDGLGLARNISRFD